MRRKLFLVVVVTVILFVLAIIYLFFQNDSNDGKWRYVTKRTMLGDYVPVTKAQNETACKTKMDIYLKENGYSACEFIESTAAHTPEECKESLSQGGCSICKFRCIK